MRDSEHPSRTSSREAAPAESVIDRFLRTVEALARARARRDFSARFAAALPLSAAGAAAASLVIELGVVAPPGGGGSLPTPLLLAAAAAGAALAAALVARLSISSSLSRDVTLRRVAADVDRGLSLSDRTAAAVDVLRDPLAPPKPGSMGELVVSDAVRRIPPGADRALFARRPLTRAFLVALPALLLALAPRALRLPTVERLLRSLDAATEPDVAGARIDAAPLVLLSVDPDRGYSGATVTVSLDGLGPGPVAVRFGGRDARVVTSVGRTVESIVPDGLPLGPVPVAVRQARRRSNALSFLVLPPPPRESGGGGEKEPKREPESEPEDTAGGAPAVPPPAGGEPPDDTPPPPVAPKKTTRRFILPLESEAGETRVKEAFTLEPDPENSPANLPLPNEEASGESGGETPFRRAKEEAVRRPDLGDADREVVRRYFEKLAPKVEREKR